MKRILVLCATLGLPWPARALPSVFSNTDCPSAPAVQAELAGLVPAAPGAAEVRIRSTEQGLVIELSSEGEPMRSRDLQADGDCATRARAAALVAAAWLDALPAKPPAAPEPAPAPKPAAPASAPPAASEAEPARTAAPVPARRLWLGLGALGLIDGWGSSVGALGDVQLNDLTGPVNLGVSLALPLARDQELGQGTAHVWRPSSEFTLRLPLGSGAWNVEPGLGLVLALLRVQGHGYDHDNTDTVISWGARTQLRVQRNWGDHRVWIEAGARWWPFDQHVRNDVNDSSTSVARAVPRWDGQLAVGFSFAAF